MIAVDTNILVYAHREDSSFHSPANRIITEFAEGVSSWAIPWPCIYEFYSIVTHPRIYNPPSPYPTALDQISAWLESPSLLLISETRDYWETVEKLIRSSQIKGPMVHDARIAAICLHHGVTELLSADRDFGRFQQLKVINPLI
ncbi:MAG: type II toxin-antitoxin system VapC family toxin [Proteobacteria bacterium]|nr:type II toxin-antitoxin system VapC family toxin [Pseudomonadota bacterium]